MNCYGCETELTKYDPYYVVPDPDRYFCLDCYKRIGEEKIELLGPGMYGHRPEKDIPKKEDVHETKGSRKASKNKRSNSSGGTDGRSSKNEG